MKRYVVMLLAWACTMTTPATRAAIEEGVNRIRQRGCEGKPGIRAPLRRSAGLDEVAREWAKGGRLQQAIARTAYRVESSASMRIEGANDEHTLLGFIAESYCDAVLNPQFAELGVHQRAREVWIVLATPLTVPTAQDEQAISARVLELVNKARAQPRKCGSRSFPPVPPLQLSQVLARPALAHAKDMSARGFFEHRGSDGSKPADRVTRAGYSWKSVGENIAVGATTAQAVVRGWLDSPGHCSNIMGAQYTQMGVAYFSDPQRKGDVYWVQVFATPR